MIQYDHPSITIEEPTPGYLVITGHAPQSRFVEGVGHIVPPSHCIIPAEIPADLLRAIADDREGKVSTPSVRFEEQKPTPGIVSPPPLPLLERILNVLAEGNIQVGKLAERLDVSADEIKALDGTSPEFHIAHAGWVKLGKKEGEA